MNDDRSADVPDAPGVAVSRALRRALGGFWGIMSGPCRFCGGHLPAQKPNTGTRQVHLAHKADGKVGQS
jgi:hypothetical protein